MSWVYDNVKKCYVFLEGGSVPPKKEKAGILKRMYYWRSPEYEGSFNQAFRLARQNNDEDFWWDGNIYNTNLKPTSKSTSKPLDFSGIVTTSNRSYNPEDIAYINDKLSSIDSLQRSAILANIIEESGGNPLAVGPGGFYGLLQWGSDRYSAKSKDRKLEMDNQIQYILDTLHNTTDKMSWHHGGAGSGYNSALAAHDAFTSPDIPVDSVNWAYTLGHVRPKGKTKSARNRSKVANQIYNIIK